MRTLVRGAAWWGAAMLVASVARAHVIYDRVTLEQQTAGAEVVVVLDFASGLATWSAPDASDHQEFYAARLRETLKGAPPPPAFDLFSHAEGAPSWAARDRALVFLDATAERAEFVSLAPRFPFFTLQGAGQEWTLSRANEAEVLAIVRGYIALARTRDAARPAARRALLVRGIGARDPRLRADALAELVRAREVAGVLDTPADVAPFVRALRPGALPDSERIALALLLDARGGFDATPTLRAMTRAKLAPTDRRLLARVASIRGDAQLARWLESLRGDPDPELRAEAERGLANTRDGASLNRVELSR